MGWDELIRRVSLNPAKILGLDRGTLKEGSVADIIIVDPDKEWIVAKDKISSKSKNSAFIGRQLKSCVEYTILKGKIVFKK